MIYKLSKGLTSNYKLILVLILILAAFLRFYNLDFQSPWLDEIHTLNESNPNHSIFELYKHITRGEQLPPLYFYLLYFVFKIFGYSIFVARAFSAVLGVITVYSLFLLTKELINKKTAIIATVIVCINYYMIYYSQEARPYMLFTLFTILSYYRMVLFIKNHSVKNAIWFGVVACFMIHSHLVGLFTLFAQFVTLTLYYIFKEDVNRKELFKGGIITALTLLILYIPAIDSLLNLFEIKSFWLRPPTADSFTLIYNDFFGKSEIIQFFNLVFFIGFLYWLVIQDKKKATKNGKKLSGQWVSIILVLWVSITILIPLIRTHISVPMILGRYFIAIVPAIIIIFAIGLSQIKNTFVSITLVTLYSIFTLIHLFIIKDYYTNVKKAQFREATSYIMENNEDNHEIVTSLPQYLPYFFNKENKGYEIRNSNLDAYAAKQIKKQQPLNDFWYFDGHNRKDNPKVETKNFLNKHYYVQDSYSGFQAWTKHYVVKNETNIKTEFTTIELEKLLSSPVKSNIDKFKFDKNSLYVKGWAFLKNIDSKNTKLKLILFKEQTVFFIESIQESRPDVAKSANSDFNVDFSGFEVNTNLDYIPEGNYKLGVWLKNDVDKIEGLFLSKKEIKIQ